MITALLDAVVSTLLDQQNGLRLDRTKCGKAFPDGAPPAVAGDIYVGVHEGASQAGSDNSLDEYVGFSITISLRASNVAQDRIPDQLIARTRLAQELATELGLDTRADKIRSLMHMNWGTLAIANQNIVNSLATGVSVYGFCEPARYRGRETAVLKDGTWWWAEDGAGYGVKAELRFERCRRLQAIGMFV